MRKWKHIFIIIVVIIFAFTGCGQSIQRSLENPSEEMKTGTEEIAETTIKDFGDILKSYLENWINNFGNFPQQWPLENYFGGVS